MRPNVITGLLASILCATTLMANERPNIILMMADDLGWGDPSYNDGWINTPTLDAMATEGLRFDRFYAASAVCSPTRGSCLTGRNPIRLGIPNANTGRLAADESPLSEVLDGVGYATGHFGKWHLGTLTTLRNDSNRGALGNSAAYSPPWQHGYDDCFATEAKVPTFHPMRRTLNALAEPLDFADPNFYGTYYWTPPTDPAAAEGTPVDVTDNLSGDDSRAIMDRVIPFVQGAVAAGDPFFTVVWFHTPHKPLTDPDGISGVDSADAYINAIVDMDTQIARLRTELNTLGVSDQTMFWFCSDNGPENGVGRSGPYRDRKRSLHEGGVRVPGILVWPEKITAGRATDFPVVTSDYYPTILDYLCLSVPNQKPIDGISLRGIIENTTSVRNQPIGFNYSNSRSWVTQQYKLISQDNGNSFELYDLLADESEQDNIAATNPEILARLTNEFQTWQAAVDNDTEYIPPSDDATVTLSTTTNPVDGEFSIDVTFSKSVTGLTSDDFTITNGGAKSLSGSGSAYTLDVTPAVQGLVTIQLPAGSTLDLDTNPNLASNQLSILFTIATPSLAGNILIDDHFDDGLIDSWIGQGNFQTATHNIREANSLIISEVIGSQVNTNRGIASNLSFDPIDSDGFALTFVVESVEQTPAANGFFLGIVGDNGVFYRDRSTRNFGLTFFGTEARTNSQAGFGLNFGDNFGATGAPERLADQDAELASFRDGFTATIQADPFGWQYEITGMNNPSGTAEVFAGAGNWIDTSTSYADLFSTDTSWHVVTSNQLAAIGTHRVSVDRIRLVSGADPGARIISADLDLSTGELDLQWTSVEGRRYQIERSTDLVNWITLGTVTATDRATTFADTDADADQARQFYRIRLL
ncbi:MAG: arylsulfatase A-like enzyme [Verrucomicrobiales bacterium]|jgi:arylsulfatase A-like enzyme